MTKLSWLDFQARLLAAEDRSVYTSMAKVVEGRNDVGRLLFGLIAPQLALLYFRLKADLR